MGWLNPDEQKALKKKYKINIAYVCNSCNLPILDTPFVDPKGGYHSWPKHLPNSCRNFLTREPKRTYHYKCGHDIFSKSGRKRKLYADISRAADRILKRISKKKRQGYWTKEKLFHHYQAKLSEKIIKKALTLLRKEKRIRK